MLAQSLLSLLPLFIAGSYAQTVYLAGDSTMALGGGGTGTDGARHDHLVRSKLGYLIEIASQAGASISRSTSLSLLSTTPLLEPVPAATPIRGASPHS